MKRYDPNLRLVRLVVLKSGKRAYDERFHAGVNIIRGVPGTGNSVGKSTIADLIFFALGGDLTAWKDEAALCDEVYAEVLMNGATVTLRREISRDVKRPMWVYFDTFDEAVANWPDGWQRYSYSRLGDRESFTQVLFRALAVPEAPSEAESNITMHQVLRLMYVDQLTPVDRIFRFENNDSALRRQAVGDLMCGVLDHRIYPAQLALRDAEKKYERATQQYLTLQRVLAASGEGFNLDFVLGRLKEITVEITTVETRIAELKGNRFSPSAVAGPQSELLAGLKLALDKVNADLTAAELEHGQLKYAATDADILIDDIRVSLRRLIEGQVTAEIIGPIEFGFCPSCFASTQDEAEGVCHLCRRDVDPHADQSRVARMRNELEQQLKESLQIQDDRRTELDKIADDISRYRFLRNRISSEFTSISQNYTTEADAEIDSLVRRSGYLEREVKEVERERRIAEQLQVLSDERDDLNKNITALKADIGSWIAGKEFRQRAAYSSISSKTAAILDKDIHTEAEFSSESDVYFNFSEDRVTVNGKSGFSASSLTVIRNAFHLAMLWASCVDRRFNYPRFLLLDNIEDKGMTQERSQRFQKTILDISNEIDCDHQIIFTTSMISDEMESSGLTVGDMYSFSNKSLKISTGTKATAPEVLYESILGAV